MNRAKRHIFLDVLLIILSILLAVWAVKSGFIHETFETRSEGGIIAVFIAGLLFTSLFTVAPATGILIEIAGTRSPLEMALIGGLGAMLGDYVIFRLIRDRIALDIRYLFLKKGRRERIHAFLQIPVVRWIIPLVGALVIASPLPDEIGLAMLGTSKINHRFFLLLTFFLNGAGIFFIALTAQALKG